MHDFAHLAVISVCFSFVPCLLGPYADLSSCADEHNVLFDSRVTHKSFVKDDSAAGIRSAFLGCAKYEVLNFFGVGFGQSFYFFNLGLPILRSIYGEVIAEFSCDVKLIAKVIAELSGNKHALFRV